MSSYSFKEFEQAPESATIAPIMARTIDPESVDACGKRLEATREALGLSQAEICRQTGIKAQAWNNAETGDNRLTVVNALKLCRRYGLTTDWLYRGDARQLAAELAHRVALYEAGQKPRKRA